ncbi:hypothetical protein I4U23_016062 [Adineta vaga]|nr:hypothetical protein I4U23_016062 [Adineta vaga]
MSFSWLYSSYFIFLFLSILPFILTRSLAFTSIQIITLQHPILEQFNNKLQCLCSNTTISSNLFNRRHSNISYLPIDFRTSASMQFQALASLCNISQTIVEKNLNEFLRKKLIVLKPISASSLLSQIQAIVADFQTHRLDIFYHELQLIQQMIISNQLLSGLETNFVPYIGVFSNGLSLKMGRLVYQQTKYVSSCSCRLANCQLLSGIYDVTNNSDIYPNSAYMQPYLYDIQMIIPGLVISCYPMQSILRSTLELSLNVTVEDLFRNLMIETWTSMNFSYEQYYSACAPFSCSYAIVKQNDFFDIFRIFISFYGGLTIVLRFMIP